jgi:hypothetical protein
MAWGNMRKSWYPSKFTAPLSLLLATALLLAAACATPKPPPSPPITKSPSKVITEDNTLYFVWGLKLPGTSQEVKLKNGRALTWVPLSIIRVITVTGPEDNQYRPAQIFLNSGERLTGDLFVDQLIEGTTDVGYWNISLQAVKQVGMGEQ